MAAGTCHRIRVPSSPLSSSRCSFRCPEYIPDPKYIVRVFKTTLRDGEQSPGATMTAKEKPDTARQLAGLGVDIIKVISNLCRDGGAPTTPNS